VKTDRLSKIPGRKKVELSTSFVSTRQFSWSWQAWRYYKPTEKPNTKVMRWEKRDAKEGTQRSNNANDHVNLLP